MLRLFTRKGVDDTKVGKVEEAKEGKSRKSLFGKSHGIKSEEPVQIEPPKPQQQPTNQTPNQNDQSTNSSASSAVSIPPSAPYLPTPTGSSSSFSSVASYNEASSPSPVSTAPSTAPSSTLSRSPNSNTSISSLNSAALPSKSLVVPSSSSTPTSGPQSSHTEPRKQLSPLSAAVDTSVHYPPSSDDDEDDGLHPRRRNSIYNIFRKSHSQPNLNPDPPSRSSSTTTLPSAYNAPQGSGSMQRPPSAHNRKTVSFLRRKSSNHSLEDVVDGDGILSRDETIARRAILQGDPLGGGAYHYPMGLACKSDLLHQPSPVPHASRSRRGAAGRVHDPRRSWQVGHGSYGNGGMAWRAPHIGGRNGGRMTIEEENDIMEQQQYQSQRKLAPGGFIEETPQFQQPQQQRLRPPMNRRPTSSQSGRGNSAGYGYYNGGDHHRSGYYPPFAPPPMLPVINQQSAQSVPA